MKKIALLLFFLFATAHNVYATQNKQTITTTPIGSFGCVCESALSKAFNDFQTYIIDNNLQKLLDSLVDLYNNIENTTAELESQQLMLKKSNNIYKEKVIELENYLYNLKKQKTILSTGESLISNNDITSIDK